MMAASRGSSTARSGAARVEVGATNKVYLQDFERALTPKTALLMRCHPSNYRITGFTADVEPRALAELGERAGIPVIEDLGSANGTFANGKRVDETTTLADGDKIPRKGGPGVCASNLLIINKIDLAEAVGASLSVMASDTERIRGDRPYLFTNLKTGEGLDAVVDWVLGQVQTHASAPEPAAREASAGP